MVKKYYLCNLLFSLFTATFLAQSIEPKIAYLHQFYAAQIEIERIKNCSYEFMGDSCDKNEGFIADTKVKTLDGFTSIENLKIGDKIIGYDLLGNRNNKIVLGISTELISQYLKISTEHEVIYVAPNQKFYLFQEDQWIYAKHIKLNDELSLNQAGYSSVKNIEIIEDTTCMYTITVDDYVFFITSDYIMVHNAHLALTNTLAFLHIGRIAIKHAVLEIFGTAALLGNAYANRYKELPLENNSAHTLAKSTVIAERMQHEKSVSNLRGLRDDFIKIKNCLEYMVKLSCPPEISFTHIFLNPIIFKDISNLHVIVSPEQELTYNNEQKDHIKSLREIELKHLEEQISDIQIALAFHFDELINARNKSLDEYNALLPAISRSIKEWNSNKHRMNDGIALAQYEHIHLKAEDIFKNIEHKNQELKAAIEFYKNNKNGILLKKTTNLLELIAKEEKSISTTEQLIDKERGLNFNNQKIVESYLLCRAMRLSDIKSASNSRIKIQRQSLLAKELSESINKGTSIKPPEDPKKNNKNNFFETLKVRANKTAQSNKFGKMYRDPQTKLWWSKDTANHGGSDYKVFKEGARGFEWQFDADALGKEIAGKHKGPTGLFIPYKEVAF